MPHSIETNLTFGVSPTFASDVRRALQFVAAVDVLLIGVLIFSDFGVEIPIEIIRHHLSMRGEAAAAAWYSSTLFFCGAILAVIIAREERRIVTRSKWMTAGWCIVAAALMFISVDEVCQIHEWSGMQVTSRVGEPQFGWEHHTDAPGGSAWVLALSPFIVIAAVSMALTFWHGFRSWSRARVMSLIGLLCWCLVIGIELLEGRMWRDGLRLSWQSTIEESLELIGITLMIFAFCRRLGLTQHK